MGKRTRGFVPAHMRGSRSRIKTCIVASGIVCVWAVGMVFYEVFVDVAPPAHEVDDMVEEDFESLGMNMKEPCLRLDRWGSANSYVCNEQSRGSLPGLTDPANKHPGTGIREPCVVLDFGGKHEFGFATSASVAGCAVYAFRPGAGCACGGAACLGDTEVDPTTDRRTFNMEPQIFQPIPVAADSGKVGVQCADGAGLTLIKDEYEEDGGLKGRVFVINEGLKADSNPGKRPYRSLRRWVDALGLTRIDILHIHVGGDHAAWEVVDALISDQYDVPVEQLVLDVNFAANVNSKVSKAQVHRHAETLERLQSSGRFELVHRAESESADISKLGRRWRRSTYHLAFTVTTKWRAAHHTRKSTD